MKSTAILAIGAWLLTSASALADPNWKDVGEALGKSGTTTGQVYRVGLPRTDLRVTLDGVQLKAGFALGSWVAFLATGDKNAMVMGDLVLTEEEVGPVMKRLADSGLEITALHNHLLRETPTVMFMHIEGHGDAVKLATEIHQALALSKTPFAVPSTAAPAAAIDFDTKAADRIMGRAGKASGGVYQFAFVRAQPIKEDGMTIPAAMGAGIGINFQPTGGGKAAITGDFVLAASEVNPVLRALRNGGVEVTALHSHMLFDQPRTFFMHFWANGDAAKLATTLRDALDKVDLARN